MKNDEISKKRREEVALLFSAQNVLHSDFPPRITEVRSDNQLSMKVSMRSKVKKMALMSSKICTTTTDLKGTYNLYIEDSIKFFIWN